MSHDFKHMVHAGPRPVPIWLWLFALIALAAFAGLLVYLDQYEKGQLTADNQLNFERLLDDLESKSVPSKDEVKKPVASTEQKDQKTDFDFYNILPKLEVKIPSAEQAKQQRNPVYQTPSPVVKSTTSGEQFYLQAGSFNDQHTADRMSAALEL